MTRFQARALGLLIAAMVVRVFPSAWCGRDATRWLDGDESLQRKLADDLVRFEQLDDGARTHSTGGRFAGEWALVTHQMVALGLAQLCLAHSTWRSRYAPFATKAAAKSFGRDMRDFGTRAWGEDAMDALGSSDGHAYLSYAALALGMARLVDADFPASLAAQEDVLVAAYERRLLASPTGLIETYPNEAYPTDVAAVAAAIAVHGRATRRDHHVVISRWAKLVRDVQIDRRSGFVIQRMGARDGVAHDAPRASGTALAAYFASFADRALSETLANAVFSHEPTFLGFGAIHEYAEGHSGHGDVDSGPVILGVSVAATGFALASAKAFERRGDFERLYRTTDLFGLRVESDGRTWFASGGVFGSALLLAFLTAGPELPP